MELDNYGTAVESEFILDLTWDQGSVSRNCHWSFVVFALVCSVIPCNLYQLHTPKPCEVSLEITADLWASVYSDWKAFPNPRKFIN